MIHDPRSVTINDKASSTLPVSSGQCSAKSASASHRSARHLDACHDLRGLAGTTTTSSYFASHHLRGTRGTLAEHATRGVLRKVQRGSGPDAPVSETRKPATRLATPI